LWVHMVHSDEDYDFDISTEIPPHPGLNLYSLSKGIGQEICKVRPPRHSLLIWCVTSRFYDLENQPC
jgi:hypothetical protein